MRDLSIATLDNKVSTLRPRARGTPFHESLVMKVEPEFLFSRESIPLVIHVVVSDLVSINSLAINIVLACHHSIRQDLLELLQAGTWTELRELWSVLFVDGLSRRTPHQCGGPNQGQQAQESRKHV